jgi:lipopolysaccharide export system permease protein
MSQLQQAIDSVDLIVERQLPATRSYLEQYYYPLRDSNFSNITPMPLHLTKTDFIDNFPANRREHIIKKAVGISRNIKSTLASPATEMNIYQKTLTGYYIEWHRKIVLAFSIFSLFLIGAPLGAIVRKGGLGLPAVISTFLFILYYIISLIGEKLAKQAVLTPFWGMWYPVFLILPIGLFLVYKANQDSKFLSSESYNRFWQGIVSFVVRKKRNS